MRSLRGFDPAQRRDAEGRWADTDMARIEAGVTVTTAPGQRQHGDLVQVGDSVKVAFSDGGSVTGTLAAIRGDEIDIEHTDGRSHWTATYSRTGDDETPAVTLVEKLLKVPDGFEEPVLF